MSLLENESRVAEIVLTTKAPNKTPAKARKKTPLSPSKVSNKTPLSVPRGFDKVIGSQP